ncbi:uncharacterized mitochondrial protein AtMg00810-like [Lotus japonicus]|uniref:uncharacterized mitochondrial protein AtMg00810-like n=1 Tax=Lotus japonicus TaxID=34305 RepID=UPI0025887DB5|nr:uncharacterized mitochondrial protein AtMg00810-like [Lotus japonicus]
MKNGFSRGKIDNTLFTKHLKDDYILVQLYVDDIIFGAISDKLCKEFSTLMQSELEMSMMGELKLFLGLQIKQEKDKIYIHQTKYIKDMLKKYNMHKSNDMSTPMYPNTVLDKNDESSLVDPTSYRGMIGSLMYLTSSRPDIMFSVCLCARFQVNPQQSHLSVVKRIFRYLIGTTNLGLLYEKGSDFRLKGFCDADYAGDKVERKSTSGGCHFLGNCLVSWSSKRQSTISLSTAEAEYVAASSCCTQLLWIKHQLEDYNFHESSIPLLCDNTSVINIAKNLVQHSRTKHIEIKHHFIRNLVEKGHIDISHVHTEDQLADILTKPLLERRFADLRRRINMQSAY